MEFKARKSITIEEDQNEEIKTYGIRSSYRGVDFSPGIADRCG
jgi:hypothetical protein